MDFRQKKMADESAKFCFEYTFLNWILFSYRFAFFHEHFIYDIRFTAGICDDTVLGRIVNIIFGKSRYLFNPITETIRKCSCRVFFIIIKEFMKLFYIALKRYGNNRVDCFSIRTSKLLNMDKRESCGFFNLVVFHIRRVR